MSLLFGTLCIIIPSVPEAHQQRLSLVLRANMRLGWFLLPHQSPRQHECTTTEEQPIVRHLGGRDMGDESA